MEEKLKSKADFGVYLVGVTMQGLCGDAFTKCYRLLCAEALNPKAPLCRVDP